MKRGLKLNVLVACESSATVRDAFRALGHNAWSCDLLPCDGDPRYHYQMDVMEVLNGTNLIGGIPGIHLPKKWDLLIGHPPCTYLCNSGVRWLFGTPPPSNRGILSMGGISKGVFKGIGITRLFDKVRWNQMVAASMFFHKLWTTGVRYVAIENPIPHKYGKLPRYTQIIQPYWFGHLETKATCLWLKNLPPLTPIVNVKEARRQTMMRPASERNRIHRMSPGPGRWKERSKTFEGIAKAMASQWSAHIIAERQKP